MEKILAVGYSVRHIVCSGARAGYEMYAADAFGDEDTKWCARRYIPLEHLLNRHHGLDKSEAGAMDGIILGSGLENADLWFVQGREQDKILGNPPSKMREVSNKAWLAAQLEELNIPHPRTCHVEEMGRGCGDAEQELHYPVVLKPIYGGGGRMNVLCMSDEDVTRFATAQTRAQGFNFIIQEYIRGRHASVSTLSTGKEAVSVAVNEQLIGLAALHAPGSFSYCGNITPLTLPASHARVYEQMCEIAEFLTLEFGLKGSNGFDFVISTGGSSWQPFLIEINPRFQGSLDTVERSTGLNLVSESIKAVREGVLPDRVTMRRYAVKLILYADRDMVVNGIVSDFKVGTGAGEGGDGIADIPPKGRFIRAGEPVASCIGAGNTRGEAILAAMRHLTALSGRLGIRRNPSHRACPGISSYPPLSRYLLPVSRLRVPRSISPSPPL